MSKKRQKQKPKSIPQRPDAKPLFWIKTGVIDEIVYNRKKESEDTPYSHQLYEEMCKEPVVSPKGDILGYTHNYPYLVFLDDQSIRTIYEREFETYFPHKQIPAMEITDEWQPLVDSFTKEVHGV